ncbi:MAG: hypothetical protein ACOX2O_05130 [Bdellovibrionota bacterium]|jgi:hypothetical protein
MIVVRGLSIIAQLFGTPVFTFNLPIEVMKGVLLKPCSKRCCDIEVHSIVMKKAQEFLLRKKGSLKSKKVLGEEKNLL